MPYLKRFFEQTGLSQQSLGRIMRLIERSLSLPAIAIYLDDNGVWRRVCASDEYPPPKPHEHRLVEELKCEELNVIEDARQHPRLPGFEWVDEEAGYLWWACAPIRPPSQKKAMGYLVVADEETRGFTAEERETLHDAAQLIVDSLEARELTARIAQIDRMTTIGTLAAGVAHEINNPLSFVSGNIQYALKALDGDEPADDQSSVEDIAEALEDALEGSRRVRDVVRDLHRLARGSGNGDAFTIEPVSVNQALETSLNIARNHIERRARLTVDIDSLRPVMGNEPKLGQVFLNLLVNAAQAIPRGDSDNNEVRVTARQLDEQIVVEVSDTGTGIPDQHLDSIFEPFFSTKTSEEGTGLGLAISKNIVATLGGDIEVDTELGEGTTFRVILPTADSHGPPGDLSRE